ncbi:hypothetical protein [Pseudomonas anguilliseptica]
MEFLRRRIESQVLSLSGIALGQIDFEGNSEEDFLILAKYPDSTRRVFR